MLDNTGDQSDVMSPLIELGSLLANNIGTVQSGPVRSSPVYLVLYISNATGVVVCRLSGTIRCLGQTLYQINVQLGLPYYSMSVMHTAISCTGSTADRLTLLVP